MRKFASFDHTRHETRLLLRDRFGRGLRPVHEGVQETPPVTTAVNDVELLELLARIRIQRGDDLASVQASYAAHRAQSPASPSFDGLLNEGWFRVTWGRIVAERTSQLPDALRQRSEFEPILGSKRYDIEFNFDDVSMLSHAAQELAQHVCDNATDITTLDAASPTWVAARLWERRSQADDTAALRWWIDRWALLGHPIFSPLACWPEAHARAWRRAAYDVLRNDPGLATWSREKELTDNRRALGLNDRRSEYAETLMTVVDRYASLHDSHVDHWGLAHELCGDTWALLALLCEDLGVQNRELEEPSSGQLLELVAGRPILLALLVGRIYQQPILLADVALHPATSLLACILIADWNAQPVSAWERDLQDADNDEARERAFADAMAIAAKQVRTAGVPLEEVAAFVVWIHARAQADEISLSRRPRKITTKLFDTTRDEFASLARAQLEGVLASIKLDAAGGLGTPKFTAALDVATFASLVDSIDADALAETYAASLRHSAPHIIALTTNQAATLVLAAKRSIKWGLFLHPVDIGARLATIPATENEYSARDKIAEALRAHIRVLSRAIAGWSGAIPAELIDALATTIRNSSCDHRERARLSAFAAHFEAGFAARPERPIAEDIASALKRIPDGERGAVEAALLLIDEPLVLARLVRMAPLPMRASLQTRMEALVPDEARSVSSLTEIQGRIDELLKAGATKLASKYINIEQDLKTLGHVHGRVATRLSHRLRLALAEKNYTEIAESKVPDALEQTEKAQAEDVVDFYKGVAALSNPNGSISDAEKLFAGLARRHPENATLAVNLFSARVAKLLRDNTFKKLENSAHPEALSAIQAADTAIANTTQTDLDARALYLSKKALLLLSLGRFHAAYDVVREAKAFGVQEDLAAYEAVALARMGRNEQASTVLAVAEAANDNSLTLKEAQEHLKLGHPSPIEARASSDGNRLTSVRSALFELKEMTPQDQALVASHDTVAAHVTAEIRSAAAAVTGLVPALGDAALQEDDVTAILSRLLEARARFFGWSIPDQSKGGYSEKGNPGERDLLVRKNGAVIAVIEAVVCRSDPMSPSAQKNLISHFQKLFGYEQCPTFFHVTYSYVDHKHDVPSAMTAIARSNAPNGIRFQKIVDLPRDDSSPRGFVATYKMHHGAEAQVVFLVMDMGQEMQRRAAATAGKTLRAKTVE